MKKYYLLICIWFISICSIYAQSTISFGSGITTIGTVNYVCSQNAVFTINCIAPTGVPSTLPNNLIYYVFDVTNPSLPPSLLYKTAPLPVSPPPAKPVQLTITLPSGGVSQSFSYRVDVVDPSSSPIMSYPSNVITVTMVGTSNTLVNPSSFICPEGGSASLQIGGLFNPSNIYDWEREVSPGVFTHHSFGKPHSTTTIPGKYRCSVTTTTTTGFSCTITTLNTCEVFQLPKLSISSMGGSTVLSKSTPFVTLGQDPLPSNIASLIPGYNSFQWYKNGVEIPGATSSTYIANSKGNYSLIANNGLGTCASEISNLIKVTIDCDDALFNSYQSEYKFGYIFTGNNTLRENSVFGGDIIVSNGSILTLAASDILMLPCTKITVEENAELNILGSHLFSCDSWKGIEIMQGGSLNVRANSIIEDAEVAIYSQYQANNIDIQSSNFKNNRISIGLVGQNWFNILNNSFYEIDFFSKECNLNNETFSPINQYGFIYLKDSKGIISSNNFIGNSGYLGTHNAIYALNISNSAIENNFSMDLGTSFEITNGKDLSFYNNTFMYCQTGMRLEKVANYYINSNKFKNGLYGIQAYNDSYSLSDLCIMSLNEFQYMYNAINIAPQSNPVSSVLNNTMNPASPSADQVIRLSCNLIQDCNFGIIGCGPIIDQGNTLSAGNVFSSNSDWDLIWNTGNNFMNYYHSSMYIPNSSLKLTKRMIFINGSPISSWNNNVNLISTSLPSECKNGFKTGEFVQESKVEVSMFPNPTFDNFFVEFNNVGENNQTFKIEAFNLIGEKVYESSVFSGIQNIISCLDWKQGLYLIKISDKDGEVYINKMTVVK